MKLIEKITSLALVGLIHCDFNEYNMLISDEEELTMIDFPQMISTDHYNAEYYFDRFVMTTLTLHCAWLYFSCLGSFIKPHDPTVMLHA